MYTKHQIQYTTTVNAPLETVWDALTNPEMVRQFLFGSQLITDWKEGSEIIFQGEWEGQTYRDKGIVLEYQHQQKLAYSYLSNWSGMEDKPEDYLWVSYEVKPGEKGTELTIYQSNYDEEKAEHSKGNWANVIDGLKKLVE